MSSVSGSLKANVAPSSRFQLVPLCVFLTDFQRNTPPRDSRAMRISLTQRLSGRGLFLLSVLGHTLSGSPCSEARNRARLHRNGESQWKGTHPLQDAQRTVKEHWHVHSISLWLHPKKTLSPSDGTAGSDSPKQGSCHQCQTPLLERHHCPLQIE